MSTIIETQNRRSIERYDLRLLCRLRAQDDANGELELYTRDVSSEGAFFLTKRPLPVQSRVRMTLFLPANGFGPSKIATQGQVVRCESDGIAVRFDPSYTISRA